MSHETPIGNLSGGISDEDARLVDSILNDINDKPPERAPQGPPPQAGPSPEQQKMMAAQRQQMQQQIMMQDQMIMQQQQMMMQQQMLQQQAMMMRQQPSGRVKDMKMAKKKGAKKKN